MKCESAGPIIRDLCATFAMFQNTVSYDASPASQMRRIRRALARAFESGDSNLRIKFMSSTHNVFTESEVNGLPGNKYQVH